MKGNSKYFNRNFWMEKHFNSDPIGKPGGFGRWSDVFGKTLDYQYKERLKELWLCDTIVAVVHQ